MNTKLCTAEVKSLGARKMSFTISTGDVDRDNDTIDPKGWDLKNYLPNPTVLWNHDHTQPPIGKAVNVWSDDRGLHAIVEFCPMGMNPFADMIHDMCKGGFLNSASVGFRLLEAFPNRNGGQSIKKAELLEFSIVSIPSNPHALVQQRSVNTLAINKWLNHTEVDVDLEAIGRSADQIDLSSLEFDEPIEGIEVTPQMVEQIVERMKPALLAGLKAGLRLQAEQAAHGLVCRMTGRLD